jgi:hypothetical protein
MSFDTTCRRLAEQFAPALSNPPALSPRKLLLMSFRTGGIGRITAKSSGDWCSVHALGRAKLFRNFQPFSQVIKTTGA